MKVGGLDSLILFVADLARARGFYVDDLGLPVLFEDEIIVVVGGPDGRIVLHRDDRRHDARWDLSVGDRRRWSGCSPGG